MPKPARQPSAASDELPGKALTAALRSPAAVATFLAVAAVGLAADLTSKHYVFKSMLGGASVANSVGELKRRATRPGYAPDKILRRLNLNKKILPGVKVRLSTNPGIVFGLSIPRWIVGIATGLVIALVCYFFTASAANAHMLHLGLALVLAGALGNLYDRLFAAVPLPADGVIRHQVRDFIDCSGLYYPWVFNVADALLVIGVATLLLHSFLAQRRSGQRK
ncbi:MAG: signal peptidase II [Planctomycetota bacterium]